MLEFAVTRLYDEKKTREKPNKELSWMLKVNTYFRNYYRRSVAVK